jgi:ubiquinone biosynthesis protein
MFVELRRMARSASTTTILVIRLAIYGFLAAHSSGARSENFNRRGARLLADTLESLGATYIKLGQILAMRPDFLPLEYIEALSYFLDDVSPFPTSRAIQILEQELGGPASRFFRLFPDQPIASASFGQVYRAELLNGDIAAVKIQRPGVDALVRADLRSMALLTWAIDLSTALLTVKAGEIYREFKEYTLQELDYLLEARNVQRLYEDAKDSPLEHIPRVYWELTRPKVLVLEFLDGIWVNDILAALAAGREAELAAWTAQGLDLYTVSVALVYVLMKQAFFHGTFHADPHAGNIVIMPGNVIGLVDFGIIGRLPSEYQRNMFRLMLSLGQGDTTGAFTAILRVLMPARYVNLRSFRRDYESNMQGWLDAASDPVAPISEKTAAKLIFANLALIKRYGLHLPPVVSRFYRALLIADSVALQLSPTLRMNEVLGEVIGSIAVERQVRGLTPRHYLGAFLGYQDVLLDVPPLLLEVLETREVQTTIDQLRTLESGFASFGQRTQLWFATVLDLGARLLLVGGVAKVLLSALGFPFLAGLGPWIQEFPTPVSVLIVASVLVWWISRFIRGSTASV